MVPVLQELGTEEEDAARTLGASASDVVRLTVGQALRLTLTGAAIGLVLSIALSRLMEAGMLGVATSDARLRRIRGRLDRDCAPRGLFTRTPRRGDRSDYGFES